MKYMGSTLFLAIFVSFFVMADVAYARDVKLGYTNLSKVFDSYEKTKDFDEELQGEAEAKRSDREAIVDSIKRYRDDLELLSEENRMSKEKQIDDKVEELKAFDRDSRMTLRKKRDTMIRDILEEIEDVIQDFGKEKGYDYIFNDRVLLYKKDSEDISEEIIKRLNDRL